MAKGTVIDLSGFKVGLLTVIKRSGFGMIGDEKRIMWLCKCECGNRKRIFGCYLLKKYSKSCGCHIEHKGNKKISGYTTWKSIMTRCYNTRNHKYPIYGGRGIKMCDRWLTSFKYFIQDMGEKPSSSHTIERIDNDGNYEPSNCKWALPPEQARNKRNNHWIEYDGKRMIISDWATFFKINISSLIEMMNKKTFKELYIYYTIEKSRKLIEYDGISKTVTEWANVFGVNRSTLAERIKNGQPFDYIVNAYKIKRGILNY